MARKVQFAKEKLSQQEIQQVDIATTDATGLRRDFAANKQSEIYTRYINVTSKSTE